MDYHVSYCGLYGLVWKKNIYYKCVFACDLDECVRKIYEDNYDLKPEGDINNVNIKDMLDITDPVTFIYNDLSLAKNVSIVDTLYTSNIISENVITIDGSEVNIKGLNLSGDSFTISACNFNVADGSYNINIKFWNIKIC